VQLLKTSHKNSNKAENSNQTYKNLNEFWNPKYHFQKSEIKLIIYRSLNRYKDFTNIFNTVIEISCKTHSLLR
jgi:hypothetical protein